MPARSSAPPRFVAAVSLALTALGVAYYVPIKQALASAGVTVGVAVPLLLVAMIACAVAGVRALRQTG